MLPEEIDELITATVEMAEIVEKDESVTDATAIVGIIATVVVLME